jgi:hypothetical protein
MYGAGAGNPRSWTVCKLRLAMAYLRKSLFFPFERRTYSIYEENELSLSHARARATWTGDRAPNAQAQAFFTTSTNRCRTIVPGTHYSAAVYTTWRRHKTVYGITTVEYISGNLAYISARTSWESTSSTRSRGLIACQGFSEETDGRLAETRVRWSLSPFARGDPDKRDVGFSWKPPRFGCCWYGRIDPGTSDVALLFFFIIVIDHYHLPLLGIMAVPLL